MNTNQLKKNLAVFFDRDGVLNEDKGYVYRKEDFIWIKGAKEALALAKSKGFLSIVITNQSGICRGYYDINEMHLLHLWMKQQALEYGAKIDDIYFCPYHSEGQVQQYIFPNHPDRKPNPGMIIRAAKDYNIDLTRSLLIGDQQSDIDAANNAGLRSILFDGSDLYQTLDRWFSSVDLT